MSMQLLFMQLLQNTYKNNCTYVVRLQIKGVRVNATGRTFRFGYKYVSALFRCSYVLTAPSTLPKPRFVDLRFCSVSMTRRYLALQ